MSNIEHTMYGFLQAVARSKAQRTKQQHVQHAVHAQPNVDTQQVQKVESIVNTKATKLSDEEYKTSLIAKAIARIKGVM
jgi:hypothetical protein